MACAIRKGFLLWLAVPTLVVSLACGSGSGNPTPPASPPPVNEPPTKAEWKDWVHQNHSTLRSIDAGDLDFSDLQFLKPLVSDRRLVQLGESGHGVSQFNRAKVRLIKFLHQECGFDVIAFESSIFECHQAGRRAHSSNPISTMRDSIYGVWHCQETLDLFDYIKSTQSTARPLQLEGFDVQVSSGRGLIGRPLAFSEMVGKLDPAFGSLVKDKDSLFVDQQQRGGTSFLDWVRQNANEYKAFYSGLAAWFDEHMDALVQLSPDDPRLPLILRQTAWSMGPYMDKTLEELGTASRTNLRDAGMAANVNFLLDRVHPGAKVMVWAHNFHIQHAAGRIQNNPGVVNMGSLLADARRHEMYTLGLFMYEGVAAWNDGTPYVVKPAGANSLEATLYYSGAPFSFVNIRGRQQIPGNSWMFESILAKSWGYFDESQILNDQYDGILFVKTVTPPAYL